MLKAFFKTQFYFLLVLDLLVPSCIWHRKTWGSLRISKLSRHFLVHPCWPCLCTRIWIGNTRNKHPSQRLPYRSQETRPTLILLLIDKRLSYTSRYSENQTHLVSVFWSLQLVWEFVHQPSAKLLHGARLLSPPHSYSHIICRSIHPFVHLFPLSIYICNIYSIYSYICTVAGSILYNFIFLLYIMIQYQNIYFNTSFVLHRDALDTSLALRPSFNVTLSSATIRCL